jgi:hypothetical protein
MRILAIFAAAALAVGLLCGATGTALADHHHQRGVIFWGGYAPGTVVVSPPPVVYYSPPVSYYVPPPAVYAVPVYAPVYAPYYAPSYYGSACYGRAYYAPAYRYCWPSHSFGFGFRW